MARSSESVGVMRGVEKMEYSVLPTSGLLLQIKNQLRKVSQREVSPFHAVTGARNTNTNESIRWRVTEGGGHIELSVTDMSGHDLSVIVTLSDVWEFLISFFGSTAAALAQSDLEQSRAPDMDAAGVKVVGGNGADDLVVTFSDEPGAQMSVRMDRAVAVELGHELSLRLEQARRSCA